MKEIRNAIDVGIRLLFSHPPSLFFMSLGMCVRGLSQNPVGLLSAHENQMSRLYWRMNYSKLSIYSQ